MANDNELTGLIVKIKADSTDYISNLDKIEGHTTKVSNSVATSFNAISGAMATAGLAFGTFAATAVRDAINWGKAVDDLGDKTGAMGEESSKMLAIGKRAGISVETTNGMFAKFSKSLYTAADAQAKANVTGKESDDILTKLGITATNADGSMRSTIDIYKDVKTGLSEMGEGWQKTAFEMKLFGKSGAEMHDVLSMSNEEIDGTISKAQSLGLIISSETAVAYEKFDRDLNSAKGTMTAFGITIANSMMPQLREMLGVVQDATKAYTQMDDKQKANITSLIEIIGKLGIATIAVRTLGWAIGASLGPWGLVAGAIWVATDQLRAWNLESQKKQEKARGGKYVVVGNHTEWQATPVTMGPYSSENPDFTGGTGSVVYGPAKPPANPEIFIGGGGGEGGGGGSSGGGGAGAGSSPVVIEKTADQVAQEEANLWKLKVNAGWIGSNEYLTLIKKFSEDEALTLESRLGYIIEYQNAEKKAAEESTNTTKKSAQDKAQAEKDLQNFKLSMDKNYSGEYEKYLWAQVDILKKTISQKELEKTKEYQTASLFSKRLADEQKAEDDKVAANKARQDQRVIDANNDMIADVINGTKTGHDVLKDMWFQFVDQVVAKMFSIKTSTNIFTQLLGPMFGLGGGGSGGAGATITASASSAAQYFPSTAFSAAGGFDVPNFSGDIPAMLHKREMVLPQNLADIIRGGGAGGGSAQAINVEINQTFQSLDPAENMRLAQNQNEALKADILNSINNKTAWKNAIRNVRG